MEWSGDGGGWSLSSRDAARHCVAEFTHERSRRLVQLRLEHVAREAQHCGARWSLRGFRPPRSKAEPGNDHPIGGTGAPHEGSRASCVHVLTKLIAPARRETGARWQAAPPRVSVSEKP